MGVVGPKVSALTLWCAQNVAPKLGQVSARARAHQADVVATNQRLDSLADITFARSPALW